MKKLKIGIVVVLLIISCRPSGDKKNGETVNLSGTVRNAKNNSVKIGENSVRLDEQGAFKYQFNLNEAGYFIFDSGEKFSLFITPGDNLFLETDMENFLSTLSFSGEGAAVNNFLKNQTVREEEHSSSIAPLIDQIFSLEEEEFVAKLDSFNALFLNPLNEFLKEHANIEKKFSRYENAKLLYSWAEGRLAYPQIHRRVTQDDSFKLSENYYDFLSFLDLNDPDLLEVNEFRSFLSAYLDHKKFELKEKEPNILSMDNQNTYLQFRIVLELFSNPTIKNLYLFESMKNQIENYGILGTEYLMEDFRANCTDEKYLEEIGSLYDNDVSIRKDAETIIYKTIGTVPLEMHLFLPEDSFPSARRHPAIVFFHGGGWSVGKAEWAFSRCKYFASRGLVAASAQYRLIDRHGISPIECVADAKSAIRWIRQNADRFNIDPAQIVAGGWSAGGHIAACAAIIKDFDESKENKNISSVPNALVLWFPAVYLKEDFWFKQILQGRVQVEEISPTQNIRTGLPPAIIFQGTADTTVPFYGVKIFSDQMKNAGNRCDLHVYEGREHLFHRNPDDYSDTMIKADRFLSSLGFIKGNPDIDWFNR